MFALARPTRQVGPAKAAPECGHKSLAIDSEVKTFDCLLEQHSEVMARSEEGASTFTQTRTLPPNQRVVKAL